MIQRILALTLLLSMFPLAGRAADEFPILFQEDFEKDASHWQPFDAKQWKLKKTDKGNVFSQHDKETTYKPPHRSPTNVALLKDVIAGDFDLTAKVLSTHPDYGHRDAVLVFGYQDPAHFYYVHLGKHADDHANQIFIVNDAPRIKISLTSTDGTNWDDKWHNVKIVRRVKEGTIEIYFDDMKKPVMTAKDKTFAWGQIGIGTFDDTSDWDDVVLRGQPAKAASAKQSRPKVVLTEAGRKVHASTFVFDGHNDLPWELRTKADSSFDKRDIAKNQSEMHTDIPRLKAGGVGAQFWSVYVPAETAKVGTALQQTLEQIELVQTMLKRYPETFEQARTVSDIERIRKAGKIASLIGVEGGHSIENSIENLRRLHKLGAGYMTLTHSDTLSWADSATDGAKNQGLSPFGEEVVREMNKLGMLVDLSHVSDETMKDALRISKAPIIYSHSSARAIAKHPRNVPDDILKLVKENDGVVMVNFFPGFIVPESAEKMLKMFDVARELRKQFPDPKDFDRERRRYEAAHPYPAGDIHDVVDHIDHIAKVAGIDHVGIGSDYDGITKVPAQLEDVSTYPLITQELLNRGYNAEDIGKIMSGNILRVMKRAEDVAKELQK